MRSSQSTINTAAQKGKELRASPLRIYGQLASGKGESVFFKVWSLVSRPAPGDVPTPRSIWAAQTESSGYIKRKRGHEIEGLEKWKMGWGRTNILREFLKELIKYHIYKRLPVRWKSEL